MFLSRPPPVEAIADSLLAEFPVRVVERDRPGTFFKGMLLPSVLAGGVTFLVAGAFTDVRLALGAVVCLVSLLILVGISLLDFDLMGFGYRIVFGRKLQFSSTAVQGIQDRVSGQSPGRLRGKAHALRPQVHAYLEPEPCLAASLVVRPEGAPGCYVRAARFTEFLLRTEDGGTHLVTGEVWLEGAKADRRCTATSEVRSLLDSLEVPDHEAPAAVAEELILREGDPVEVAGTPGAEARAEFAGTFRDGGLVPTIRGTAGSRAVVRILR